MVRFPHEILSHFCGLCPLPRVQAFFCRMLLCGQDLPSYTTLHSAREVISKPLVINRSRVLGLSNFLFFTSRMQCPPFLLLPHPLQSRVSDNFPCAYQLTQSLYFPPSRTRFTPTRILILSIF